MPAKGRVFTGGSFYNMLHGVCEDAPVLLRMLEFGTRYLFEQIGRFRDCYLNEDGTKIVILTRNGGGNREHCGDKPEGDTCACSGCCIKHHLPRHPQYEQDWDDDFDRTFAYVEFAVPTNFKPWCEALAKRNAADGIKPWLPLRIRHDAAMAEYGDKD